MIITARLNYFSFAIRQNLVFRPAVVAAAFIPADNIARTPESTNKRMEPLKAAADGGLQSPVRAIVRLGGKQTIDTFRGIGIIPLYDL